MRLLFTGVQRDLIKLSLMCGSPGQSRADPEGGGGGHGDTLGSFVTPIRHRTKVNLIPVFAEGERR